MSVNEDSSLDIGPQFGFVVLIDALGTAGVTAHIEPQEVAERWSSLLTDIGLWTDMVSSGAFGIVDTFAGESEKPNILADSVDFSDTIYVFLRTEDRSDYSAVTSLFPLSAVILSAIRKGIFLRGAISFGTYYRNGNQMFGPAVEEAAAWHEQADWIGISAAPSLSHILDITRNPSTPNVNGRFVRCHVPYKSGEQRGVESHWALAWPLDAEDASELANEVRSAFIMFSGSVPPAVYPKYQHTLAFIDKLKKPIPSGCR